MVISCCNQRASATLPLTPLPAGFNFRQSAVLSAIVLTKAEASFAKEEAFSLQPSASLCAVQAWICNSGFASFGYFAVNPVFHDLSVLCLLRLFAANPFRG